MKKSVMTEPKLSWTRVAQVVSEKLGRRYTGAYCREVAVGFRSSRNLEPHLQELGVMERPKSAGRNRSSKATHPQAVAA